MPILIALGPAVLALAGVYVVLSVASVVMYGRDKAAARQGRPRIPEISLHLVSAAGGWPGALVAQRVFRHKTRKQPFRTVFWCTVIANCAAAAWLVWGMPAVWPR